MENFSYHVPFYVVTGGVKLSGHSSELQGGAVGLYDRATFSVATSIGNGKEFFFAQGNIGGKDWYGQPITETHKSPFFFGKDVENMYVSYPQTIQNEEWVVGFNGSPSSKGLSYEKGKPVRIKMYFHGDPINRFFGGPKEYVVSYTPLVDCTEPCNASDCPDGISDCITHTQQLIDNINNHTELKKFGVVAKLVNTPYTAGTVNMEKYSLSVCDNGDSVALQAVQAQYPTLKITRIDRDGSTSTYNFCQPSADSAPADFTQSASVSLAICSTCPSGSTLTPGVDVYYVSRPVVGGEDFVSGAQTYANGVGLAYFPAATFSGTSSAVNTSTDAITITGHLLSTGEKVTYSNGGGTSITPLVTATNYYVIKVDANSVKLATTYANALAGTAINITAAGVGASHSLTPVVSSKFVSNNSGNALVKISVPAGRPVTTLGADSVDFAYSEGATCTFATPSAIAWTLDATGGISSTRTLRINALQRPDCNAAGDRIADLTSILAGVQGIQINTLTKIAGTACADDYTVVQSSVDCLPEDCLTNNVTFTYDELPAFESSAWNVVPPTPSEDDTRKCGIRISAGYIDPKFGDCSFDVTDFYEIEPLKMEVSLLVEDADNCDFANLPSQKQTKVGRIARQSGEYVVREVIMKTQAYLKHMNQYDGDPRMREAFDKNLLSMVDRTKFYKLYYVTYKASYGTSFRKNEQESFTTVFAFREDDSTDTTFKSSILDVLTAKSGTTLHIAG